ncbi:MAG: dTMP kinase [Gammaproteobacteria bacterium]|nr:MAG: dTMP kinase [Gammaproteobacteria bacterium]
MPKNKINAGNFITVEGIEGVGKSTNIEFICRQIDLRGIECVVTREPGGTPMAETIRDILLEHREESVSPMTELLLMFAARAQHLDQFIKPRLDAGCWVVSDRFTDATYAYQGGGRKIEMARIQVLEDYVQGTFRPDLTILLDAPIELGLKRANKRGTLDRFEKEKFDFFSRVREVYLSRVDQSNGRIRVVDASMPLDQVQRQITQILDEYFI